MTTAIRSPRAPLRGRPFMASATSRTSRIEEYVRQHPRCTRPEIAEALQIDRDVLSGHLSYLCAASRLRRREGQFEVVPLHERPPRLPRKKTGSSVAVRRALSRHGRMTVATLATLTGFRPAAVSRALGYLRSVGMAMARRDDASGAWYWSLQEGGAC